MLSLQTYWLVAPLILLVMTLPLWFWLWFTRVPPDAPIDQPTIERAVNEAVDDGTFIAARLLKDDPEVVFCNGLAGFLHALPQNARIGEVRRAMALYARFRATIRRA